MDLLTSKTWPYVEAFALAMEAKLSENRHKGDREGWAKEDCRWLFNRLREEVAELDAALPVRLGVRAADDPDWGGGSSPRNIGEEAADVGNFAMMIADGFGSLKPSTVLAQAVAERNKMRAALEKIAAFNDAGAGQVLAEDGSYGAFDEPYSVEVARKALKLAPLTSEEKS